MPSSPADEPRADHARGWTRRRVLGWSVVGVAAVGLEVAFRAGEPPVMGARGVDGLRVPRADVEGGDFVDTVDHRWLPLPRGAWWDFEREGVPVSTSRPEVIRPEVVRVEVRQESVPVAGVATTAVLVGDTEHLVAQDRAGHVWLLGRRGPTERWSVEDGTPAGLVLPAHLRRADGWLLTSREGVEPERVEVGEPAPRPVVVPAGEFDEAVDVQLFTTSWAVDPMPDLTVTLARDTGPVAVTTRSRGEWVLRATSPG